MDSHFTHREGELLRSSLAPLLRQAAKVQRLFGFCVRQAMRLEGGDFRSATARDLIRARCGVEIGAYSYGECFIPDAFPRGVRIGRYVSIAEGVLVFLRNHPVEEVSTHPYFFRADLGYVPEERVEFGTLDILSDAWLGARSIIAPGCSRIGLGAIVGAGAVVTKDVPDFAVVAGVPARLLRMRFSEERCEEIRRSRWWTMTPGECLRVHGEIALSWRTRPAGARP